MTAAAEAVGVKPGMRLGEALATCPTLALVDRDPAAVEREWEEVLRRLEDSGFAVDPVEHGVVVFETRGVERLYGGVRPALERALEAVGSSWDPRIGAATRRFTALAAASVARPSQALLVAEKEEESFLEPLPLSLLPLTSERYAELEGLGLRKIGSSRSSRAAPWPRDWAPTGARPGASLVGEERQRYAGGSRPRSSPRCSSSRKRWATSSRCAGPSARFSNACSPAPNEPVGRFESSRCPSGSSMAARGGAR